MGIIYNRQKGSLDKNAMVGIMRLKAKYLSVLIHVVNKKTNSYFPTEFVFIKMEEYQVGYSTNV